MELRALGLLQVDFGHAEELGFAHGEAVEVIEGRHVGWTVGGSLG